MKRANENWSDIADAKETNDFLKEEILKKFSLLLRFVNEVEEHKIRTLCVKKMTREQMLSFMETDRYHTLKLLDKTGKVLREVGYKKTFRNPIRDLYRKIFEAEAFEYETVEEALSSLGKDRKRVMYALESYGAFWNDFDIYGYTEGIYWFSFYLYKTPSNYKNFAEFVGDTIGKETPISKEHTNAKMELNSMLEDIDK
ncbi:MAG: hypothetical protein WCT49_03825 [Candidatus Paceibacterota bacterium]|jgi:hypothetical protein|nr:hypothetical protein [Candidatus Paceibacterota bacterium]